jgi:hypothetical protein
VGVAPLLVTPHRHEPMLIAPSERGVDVL